MKGEGGVGGGKREVHGERNNKQEKDTKEGKETWEYKIKVIFRLENFVKCVRLLVRPKGWSAGKEDVGGDTNGPHVDSYE